jgi:hypothetical protein
METLDRRLEKTHQAAYLIATSESSEITDRKCVFRNLPSMLRVGLRIRPLRPTSKARPNSRILGILGGVRVFKILVPGRFFAAELENREPLSRPRHTPMTNPISSTGNLGSAREETTNSVQWEPKPNGEGRGRDLNPGARLHRPIGYQATSPRPRFPWFFPTP